MAVYADFNSSWRTLPRAISRYPEDLRCCAWSCNGCKSLPWSTHLAICIVVGHMCVWCEYDGYILWFDSTFVSCFQFRATLLLQRSILNRYFEMLHEVMVLFFQTDFVFDRSDLYRVTRCSDRHPKLIRWYHTISTSNYVILFKMLIRFMHDWECSSLFITGYFSIVGPSQFTV